MLRSCADAGGEAARARGRVADVAGRVELRADLGRIDELDDALVVGEQPRERIRLAASERGVRAHRVLADRLVQLLTVGAGARRFHQHRFGPG